MATSTPPRRKHQRGERDAAGEFGPRAHQFALALTAIIRSFACVIRKDAYYVGVMGRANASGVITPACHRTALPLKRGKETGRFNFVPAPRIS